MKKIFLSHAYLDRKIADKIVDKLLIAIFELDKSEDIFYTSKRDTGIRSSVNWRNNIRENLTECGIFIALITPNFKKSEMCLAEIGAAWALKKRIYPLILPPIKHENFSVVIAELQADMLMKREDINMFLNSLHEDLKTNYNINRTELDQESEVKKFLKSLRRYKRKNPHLFEIEYEYPSTNIPISDPPKNSSDTTPSKPEDHNSENPEIVNKSKEKWPDDYQMQEYEINEQKAALTEINKLKQQFQQDNIISRIINRAIQKWPGDYQMQVYEAKEQIDSFNRLNTT